MPLPPPSRSAPLDLDPARNNGAAPLQIVIADDHEIVREALRRIIQERPEWHICGEAANGPEAEERATRLRPDLLIIDIGLAGLNGIEVARRVNERFPAGKILIFSGLATAESVPAAFQAGAHGYVLKTESDRELVAAIEAVFRGERYLSPTAAKLAIGDYLSSGAANQPAPITARERQTIALIAEGQSNKEVASALGISIKTVETHRASLMRKLNLRSTADLVRYAIRHGIVQA